MQAIKINFLILTIVLLLNFIRKCVNKKLLLYTQITLIFTLKT